MRGRATRLLALDTYFMLDDEDDEDGEKLSGVSDGEDKGGGERGEGAVFSLPCCQRVQYAFVVFWCPLTFLDIPSLWLCVPLCFTLFFTFVMVSAKFYSMHFYIVSTK